VNPEFPMFIVSKGRWDTRLTAKALEEMNTPYYIVIEEQEYKNYSAVISKEKIIILDKKYQDDYDTCDDIGTEKSKGPGPARNFVWDYSIAKNYKYHWVMDDNITTFYRCTGNRKIRVIDGTIFKAMEDFCLRYENVVMAGPNYEFFLPRKQKTPPIILNTRIYSCNFIKNDTPFRWRGRYNEDTILSLDMLKAGYCTVQFNAFLQKKMPTQRIPGGNTKEFYAKEGTYSKSAMQVKVHPDVSKMVWKYGRAHHYVDYSRFKTNKLVKCASYMEKEKIDNYGMKIVKI
jgi:hypothetical protein